MNNGPIRMAHRLRTAAGGPLARGLGAFGGAELANRAVRILTTVAIARLLTPEIVGPAALALTLFELIRVLARNGVGQAIIAVPAERLAATCNTAQRIFWMWGMVIVAIQLIAALILAIVFDAPMAAGILAVLALVHVIMPAGLVHCHLAMREGQAPRMARTVAAQAIADHLLTALLLVAWQSPWAIALPKLLTAPLWLVMTRRIRPWELAPLAGFVPLRSLLGFSTKVLAAEAMVAARTNGDNLIVAAMLGTSALGTYYFAFNAGVGIIASLSGACAAVVYPILCQANPGSHRATEFRRIAVVVLAIFVPLVLLQSLAATWYVPVLFGMEWAFAAPLISIMCLGGLSTCLATLTSSWLRAEHRPGMDAAASFLTCIGALGGLAIGAQQGSLLLAAAGLVAGQSLVTMAFAIFALGPVFRASALANPFMEKCA